jgi:hypothetical protein
MPAPDYSQAPLANAARREADERDAVKAKLPGRQGAAARFRQTHGHLSDFIVSEFQLGNGVDSLVAAFGPNFATAITAMAVNSEHPEKLALLFLEKLAEDVRGNLMRLASGHSRPGERMIVTGGAPATPITDLQWDGSIPAPTGEKEGEEEE